MKLTIKDEDIEVGFTGISSTVDGPVNYPLAGTYSGVYWGLKFFLDPTAPPNAGMYRPIDIIIPENTIFNPSWPAPVYYGNFITSEKVVDSILQCLENAIPDEIVGMPYADCNPIYFGMVNPREGKSETFGELASGGWGGTPYGYGMNTTYSRHGNCMDFQPETMELLYLVICTEREFISDSGGAGQHRGGVGMKASWRMLRNASLNLGMGRTRSGPPGVCGGGAGKPGYIVVAQETSNERIIGGYDEQGNYLMTMFDNYPLKEGQEVTQYTQGGGGWGDPKRRDIALVEKDIENGFVTKKGLEEDYGIILE